MGETPNLAARLQGIAEPNSVVIAESTRKLVGDLFELQDLGSQELKGISDAVKAWIALIVGFVCTKLKSQQIPSLASLRVWLSMLGERWKRFLGNLFVLAAPLRLIAHQVAAL